MSLGLLAWSVFCIGFALTGTASNDKQTLFEAAMGSFGLRCLVWALAVGTWIAAGWLW